MATYIEQCREGGHHVLYGVVDDPLVSRVPGLGVAEHVRLGTLSQVVDRLVDVHVTETWKDHTTNNINSAIDFFLSIKVGCLKSSKKRQKPTTCIT